MGFLWTRIVCNFSVQEAIELSGTSTFAETLASFSTISQEKRHESLPSWSISDFSSRSDCRMFEEESVRAMWIKAHELLLQALKIHPSYQKVEKFLTLEQFLLHLGTLLMSIS
jgi:hypothetical protein